MKQGHGPAASTLSWANCKQYIPKCPQQNSAELRHILH